MNNEQPPSPPITIWMILGATVLAFCVSFVIGLFKYWLLR